MYELCRAAPLINKPSFWRVYVYETAIHTRANLVYEFYASIKNYEHIKKKFYSFRDTIFIKFYRKKGDIYITNYITEIHRQSNSTVLTEEVAYITDTGEAKNKKISRYVTACLLSQSH